MAIIFRKLNQKRHWDNAPWLEQQDAQADVTKCLATNENRLSVFVLDDSGPNRPLIPIESGHLFRGKPAGDSGAK